MYLLNNINAIRVVNTAPELHQKGNLSPEKKMKGIFVYVLEFMLALAKMQTNNTLM